MEEKKSPNIKILVACHKADPNIRHDEIYMPIQVGKAMHPDLDLGFQTDNTGENISEKNGSYCELTALYWAWKNLKNIDYVGLAHYRRYLDFDLTKKSSTNELKSYDIILPPPVILNKSVFEELVFWTSLEDAYIFLDSLITLHPDYEHDILNYYFNNNRFTQCNMMIMCTELFDSYCQFLFPVLELTENRLRPAPYTRHRRALGYMAETMIGLWTIHNKLKYKVVPIITDIKTNKLKYRLNNLRFNIAFKLSKHLSPLTSLTIIPPVVTGFKQDSIELTSSRNI